MTNISFEKFLLDTLANLGDTNFDVAIKIVLIAFGIFWLFVVGWVWNDCGERSTKIIYRILSALLVLVFNIPGLIVYLLLRPNATIEELYWADLERRYLKYETADLGDCPRCKKQLQAGFVVCPFCGESIKEKCTACGNYLEKSWTICPFCGTSKNIETKQEQVIESVLPVLPEKPVETATQDLPVEATEVETTEVPEVLSNEQMQAEVEETKEETKAEVVTASKEQKIKYAKSKGLFASFMSLFTRPVRINKTKTDKVINENEAPKVESMNSEEIQRKKEEKKKEKKRKKRKSRSKRK